MKEYTKPVIIEEVIEIESCLANFSNGISKENERNTSDSSLNSTLASFFG